MYKSILFSLIAVWSLHAQFKSDVKQQSKNQFRYTVKGDSCNKTVKCHKFTYVHQNNKRIDAIQLQPARK